MATPYAQFSVGFWTYLHTFAPVSGVYVLLRFLISRFPLKPHISAQSHGDRTAIFTEQVVVETYKIRVNDPFLIEGITMGATAGFEPTTSTL